MRCVWDAWELFHLPFLPPTPNFPADSRSNPQRRLCIGLLVSPVPAGGLIEEELLLPAPHTSPAALLTLLEVLKERYYEKKRITLFSFPSAKRQK